MPRKRSPPMNLEDYGMIGDRETGALVGRNGSVDWLCMPRFDSPAVFAALLGDRRNGCWSLAPAGSSEPGIQRYRHDTLVLETEFATAEGRARVVDFMPPRSKYPTLLRLVEGLEGNVGMSCRLSMRMGYGKVVPWVRKRDGGVSAIAGPDALFLFSDVRTHGENLETVADFQLPAGESRSFSLVWHPSHLPPPPPPDVRENLQHTQSFWRGWAGRCTDETPWRDRVVRSLITLKALTYRPTGGVVAALTTSLPEQFGGVRNWDYRYCWIRDATFTLMAFMEAGYTAEAAAWREWMLRAVAGDPAEIQILYGVAGERELPAWELPWLGGYEGAAPVRAGNAAANQFQLDIFGELMDAMHQARCMGIDGDGPSWRVQNALLEFLETRWPEPDEGIWEVRGPRRQFTHSKVMAWVAFDRAIKAVTRYGLEGPVERWRNQRDTIHREICQRGFHTRRGVFTQSYESDELDASLLMIPLVGFLPARDPRVIATTNAIAQELTVDGLVRRYHSRCQLDALPPGEGTFLPCSFWLVDNYVLQGRHDAARELFDQLLEVQSPLGLLAEEYDPRSRRLLGNYPQAFTHVGFINSARNLGGIHSPARERPTA